LKILSDAKFYALSESEVKNIPKVVRFRERAKKPTFASTWQPTGEPGIRYQAPYTFGIESILVARKCLHMVPLYHFPDFFLVLQLRGAKKIFIFFAILALLGGIFVGSYRNPTMA